MKMVIGLVTAILLGPTLLRGQSTTSPDRGRGIVAPDSDYLGEERPGGTPRLFAPGVVSLGGFERDIAISPDGRELLYGVCASRCTLFMTRRSPNGWSEPAEAPFAAEPDFNALEPAFSPDGRRVLFLSDRPAGVGAPGPVRAWEHQNIWMSVREPAGWSTAVVLGPAINDASASFYPSLARNGTLFFTREDKKSKSTQLFSSVSKEGEFQPAIRVAAPFNESWSPYNACISPDGAILVFCSQHPGSGPAALWASFRGEGGSWSDPVKLGTEINAPGAVAQSCSFSPDGRFFFFSSVRRDAIDALSERLTLADFRSLHEHAANGWSDVYWVDSSAVRRLRPTGSPDPGSTKE